MDKTQQTEPQTSKPHLKQIEGYSREFYEDRDVALPFFCLRICRGEAYWIKPFWIGLGWGWMIISSIMWLSLDGAVSVIPEEFWFPDWFGNYSQMGWGMNDEERSLGKKMFVGNAGKRLITEFVNCFSCAGVDKDYPFRKAARLAIEFFVLSIPKFALKWWLFASHLKFLMPMINEWVIHRWWIKASVLTSLLRSLLNQKMNLYGSSIKTGGFMALTDNKKS